MNYMSMGKALINGKVPQVNSTDFDFGGVELAQRNLQDYQMLGVVISFC